MCCMWGWCSLSVCSKKLRKVARTWQVFNASRLAYNLDSFWLLHRLKLSNILGVLFWFFTTLLFSEGQQPFMGTTPGYVLLNQAQGWGIQHNLQRSCCLASRFWVTPRCFSSDIDPRWGWELQTPPFYPLPGKRFIPSPTQPEQHAQDKQPPSSSQLLFPPPVGRQ